LPLFAALVFLLPLVAFSQTAKPTPRVLIYDLELEKTGRSVNYTFFKDGFLVVDPEAATFSSIVVLTDPNTFNFYQAADFVSGSYSEILDYAGRRNVVLFGTTSGTTPPPIMRPCRLSDPSIRVAKWAAAFAPSIPIKCAAISSPPAQKLNPQRPTARQPVSNMATRASARLRLNTTET
jgi:hypothetical protein